MTYWLVQHQGAHAARENKEDAIHLCIGCIGAGSGCVNHRWRCRRRFRGLDPLGTIN
jgi:hypothetical protein